MVVYHAGPWSGDSEEAKGIKTTPDARFFAISSAAKEAFTNEGKDLVLQVGLKRGGRHNLRAYCCACDGICSCSHKSRLGQSSHQ
jgi:hypothetical protein